MILKSNQRLARGLAIQTIFLTCVIALAASIISFNYNLNHLQQSQENKVSSLINSTLPAFNLAVFSFNTELSDELIAGLITHPNIESVIISNINNEPIFQGQKNQQCQFNILERRLLPPASMYIVPLQYNNVDLGKFVINTDSCTFVHEFHQIIWQILAFILSFGLIISGFILFIFHKHITKPLAHHIAAVAAIDVDNFTQTDLKKLQSQRQDELGVVSNQLSNLLIRIRHEFELRKQNETTTQDYSTRLETLINKRTDALADLKQHIQELQNLADFNLQVKHYICSLSTATQEPMQLLEANLALKSTAEKSLFIRLKQLHGYLQTLSQDNDRNELNMVDLKTVINVSTTLLPLDQSEFSVIYDIHDDILISKKYLEILIPGLISNALYHNQKAPLLLHVYPQDELLHLNISGTGLNIKAQEIENHLLPLNPEQSNLPSPLGLGLLKVLCQLLGGQLTLSDFSLKGQTLSCSLPYLPRQMLLTTLQKNFAALPLALQVEHTQWRMQLLALFELWQISYTTGNVKDGQIVITDHLHQHHDSERSLYLQPATEVWPGESYLLQRLLELSNNKISRLQVLLVDDDNLNRVMCQRYLSNLGINVDVAVHGLQAIEMAMQKRYQLIFMDCQMPLMDGYEATRKIRQQSLNKDTPIVALTGLNSLDAQQECLTSGMNDIISKPFSQEQLKAALEQWTHKTKLENNNYPLPLP